MKGSNFTLLRLCNKGSVWLIFWCLGKQLIIIRPSLDYEISFGTSLAKVGSLGAEKNCGKLTNRQTLNLYIDYRCYVIQKETMLNYIWEHII